MLENTITRCITIRDTIEIVRSKHSVWTTYHHARLFLDDSHKAMNQA